MREPVKKTLSLAQMIILNFYWVGISFMWNALHPIILPAVLLNYVPDEKKNTILGLLTFTGLLIAMIIQPVSGAISDGWVSRFGRRRPLMAIGVVFDLLFLSIIAWGGGFAWLVIGYIGLQFSSNTSQGSFQGLLPDQVSEDQLGVASSLKTFMDTLSLVIAALLAGRMMDPQSHDPNAIMLVVIGLLIFTASMTVFFTHEQPIQNQHKKSLRSLSNYFKIDYGKNKAYWWLTAERASFLLGIYGLQAFGQYYLQDVLHAPDPPKQMGNLLAAITVGVLILVMFGGKLTDRFGAKRILYIASFAASIGMLLMLLTRNLTCLLVFGSLVGGGIGLFLTSNWALANRLAPHHEAGKFLGLTNLATAGSGALTRLEGPVIDALNAAHPQMWFGYKGLFVFGTFCILLSVLFLRKIKIEK
jgi:MFS family permease